MDKADAGDNLNFTAADRIIAKQKENAVIQKITKKDSDAYIGGKLNFAAAEAYKLLRTNLMFSMPDKTSGRIVAITSSVGGEGKSTTSINLSYTLAESGKRVALIECDMRLPTLARRLDLQPSPGLSNLIAGLTAGAQVLQRSGLHENLYIIPAGDVPPNPSELLGSEQMQVTLKSLAKEFDFIVVDLPPVTAVTDALVASNLVDGIIVVVRQDVCTRGALAETMRQLDVVKKKILGLVFTGSRVGGKPYSKKSYRYQDHYGRGYGYGYGEKADSGKHRKKRDKT